MVNSLKLLTFSFSTSKFCSDFTSFQPCPDTITTTGEKTYVFQLPIMQRPRELPTMSGQRHHNWRVRWMIRPSNLTKGKYLTQGCTKNLTKLVRCTSLIMGLKKELIRQLQYVQK